MTTRRRSGSRRSAAVTDGHLAVLLDGADYFDDFGDDDHAEQWMREVWGQYREPLMAAWQEWPKPSDRPPADATAWQEQAFWQGRPGARPWAWWRFSAPGGAMELDRVFGRVGRVRPAGGDGPYEREDEHLARHGLLAPWEVAALAGLAPDAAWWKQGADGEA